MDVSVSTTSTVYPGLQELAVEAVHESWRKGIDFQLISVDNHLKKLEQEKREAVRWQQQTIEEKESLTGHLRKVKNHVMRMQDAVKEKDDLILAFHKQDDQQHELEQELQVAELRCLTLQLQLQYMRTLSEQLGLTLHTFVFKPYLPDYMEHSVSPESEFCHSELQETEPACHKKQQQQNLPNRARIPVLQRKEEKKAESIHDVGHAKEVIFDAVTSDLEKGEKCQRKENATNSELASPYTKPTISSQLKEMTKLSGRTLPADPRNGVLKPHSVPFILGKAPTASHHLGINSQQIISDLNDYNPQKQNNIFVTDKHHPHKAHSAPLLGRHNQNAIKASDLKTGVKLKVFQDDKSRTIEHNKASMENSESTRTVVTHPEELVRTRSQRGIRQNCRDETQNGPPHSATKLEAIISKNESEEQTRRRSLQREKEDMKHLLQITHSNILNLSDECQRLEVALRKTVCVEKREILEQELHVINHKLHLQSEQVSKLHEHYLQVKKMLSRKERESQQPKLATKLHVTETAVVTNDKQIEQTVHHPLGPHEISIPQSLQAMQIEPSTLKTAHKKVPERMETSNVNWTKGMQTRRQKPSSWTAPLYKDDNLEIITTVCSKSRSKQILRKRNQLGSRSCRVQK